MNPKINLEISIEDRLFILGRVEQQSSLVEIKKGNIINMSTTSMIERIQKTEKAKNRFSVLRPFCNKLAEVIDSLDHIEKNL